MRLAARAELPAGVWDAFLDQQPGAWFWHRTAWLDYQQAYRPKARDCSVGILDELDTLVGVLPLFVEDGVVRLDGDPSPLWRDRDAANALALPVVQHLVSCGVRRWISADRPTLRRYDDLVDDFSTVRHRPTRVVDVTQPSCALWSQIRRSYHALIHRAERAYQIEIGSTRRLLDSYELVHRRSWYPQARPQATYDIQRQIAVDGHGVVAVAFDRETGEAISAAYVIHEGTWAYYASGPTLRQNVQHALQWTILQALKNYGVTHYELGFLPEAPTAKDHGIQIFKTGFGGTDWMQEIHDVELSALQTGRNRSINREEQGDVREKSATG